MTTNQQYTYMWQPQKYISWKGTKNDEGTARNLFNVISGINKRPVPYAVPTVGGASFGPHQKATHIPATTNTRDSRVGNSRNNKSKDSMNSKLVPSGVGAISRNYGPQPMKHWRLQLQTLDNYVETKDYNAGTGGFKNVQKQPTGSYNKLTIATLMDRPGAASVSNKPNNRPSSAPCKSCDPSGNGQFSKQYFNRELLWGVDISFSYPDKDVVKPYDNTVNPGRPACVACNPENNIIKSAVTLLNKNYYTDSRAYLRSRCKLYDQKQNITSLVNPSQNFIPGTSTPAWPQDNECGPQTFFIGTCPDKCQSTAKTCDGDDINGKDSHNPPRATAIFKPNNRQFQVQGAVDSSSRIARLKYNTITKNAAGFNSAFGAQAANAAKYTTNSDGPYFIKNKLFTSVQCKNSLVGFKNGNHNVCHPIPRRMGYPQMPGGFSGCAGVYGAAQALCN